MGRDVPVAVLLEFEVLESCSAGPHSAGWASRGFALVFIAAGLVVVLRVRKRVRIVWSVLVLYLGGLLQLFSCCSPHGRLPFNAQLSASRSWLQCLPPFSRPGPTKHLGQVLMPCTKSGSCLFVAAWAGLRRFRGVSPPSSSGDLCILGVPATVMSVPSVLSSSLWKVVHGKVLDHRRLARHLYRKVLLPVEDARVPP